MNNQRRKAIKALYPDVEALGPLAEAVKDAIEKFNAAAEDVAASIDGIKEEEQEYIDNLPENLQQSEKAQNAEQAVSDLEEAIGMFDGVDFESFDKDDVIGKLDEVAGGG